MGKMGGAPTWEDESSRTRGAKKRQKEYPVDGKKKNKAKK